MVSLAKAESCDEIEIAVNLMRVRTGKICSLEKNR